jgi:hypothetical protein
VGDLVQSCIRLDVPLRGLWMYHDDDGDGDDDHEYGDNAGEKGNE